MLLALSKPAQALDCPPGSYMCACWGWECDGIFEGCYWGYSAICCNNDEECVCGEGREPSCGFCFTRETEVGIKNSKTQKLQTEKIENLKPGDMVESFNPETGEITESAVLDTTELTREGYYELETESGKKVKVTGEHPFSAVKAENSILNTENLKLIGDLKDILSNTLTYKLISSLQAKVNGILH